MAWLSVATDGRLVYWLKATLIWPIYSSIYILLLPLGLLNDLIIRKCCGYHTEIYKSIDDIIASIRDNVLIPIMDHANQKPIFSSSTLLFLGILLEDIPQLIVTFLIEDKIKSDDPSGRVSQAATFNLIFAIDSE